jgi:hypothetical protein
LAYRGVLGPPYTAARNLLEWAIDLWPYVNGKGLVSGLNIGEMEASEAVDVLHFFFEEDLFVATAEEMEAKSAVRVSIYQSMYERPYKYEYKSNRKNTSASGNSFDSSNYYEEDLVPFDPSEPPKTTKSYVPPTEFSNDSSLPFGKILDGPLQ